MDKTEFIQRAVLAYIASGMGLNKTQRVEHAEAQWEELVKKNYDNADWRVQLAREDAKSPKK